MGNEVQNNELISIAEKMELIANNFSMPASFDDLKHCTMAFIDMGADSEFSSDFYSQIQELFLRAKEILNDSRYAPLADRLTHIEDCRQKIVDWFNCTNEIKKDVLHPQVETAKSQIAKHLKASANYIRENATS